MTKPKYKLGDRVRIIKCSYEDNDHYGHSGNIIEMIDNLYHIRLSKDDNCIAEEIELITPNSRELKPKEPKHKKPSEEIKEIYNNQLSGNFTQVYRHYAAICEWLDKHYEK